MHSMLSIKQTSWTDLFVYVVLKVFCTHPPELVLESKCKISIKSPFGRHSFSMRLLSAVQKTQQSELEVIVVQSEKRSSAHSRASVQRGSAVTSP